MGDPARGLYRKFDVARTDGESAPGGRHEHCEYFVLDVSHDKFAIPALRAYARACRGEYPLLADDLQTMATRPYGPHHPAARGARRGRR